MAGNTKDEATPHGSPEERQNAPTSVQPEQSAKENTKDSKQPSQKQTLKQNVEGGQEERSPELPAGQHATGSFTGTSPEKTAEDTKRKS